MDKESQPQVIHLKDYAPPSFFITDVELYFDIRDEVTKVSSLMKVRRNPKGQGKDLFLHGEGLTLMEIKLDGAVLSESRYSLSSEGLTLKEAPADFVLEIRNEINPHKNTALEGLYVSDGIYCTQNEPHGFRRITYFVDRPDNMAKYRTTIEADKAKYPVLLSNGNPADWEDKTGGRHSVTWDDPFLKPSYLFALVAGDLGAVEDQYVTLSGREIILKIYVDKGNEYKCDFAMESLKQAMKWDEDTFGLECDLDIYKVVAVDAFNFGAMENKGLNIFNSQYILADPKTATDQNYLAIQNVIGHEYFHNWTGNRVTCRDWFQITLKEGLTVFRDQEFSADMTSRPVKRIADVRVLRDYQFVEDSGPNCHPIRPPSYIEINNFYTATVYNKGAEVIRMIETLIGRDSFRKGITKYFQLYDGQAVTTEDFIHAMEEASGQDLTRFKNWYAQAGTPRCRVSARHDTQAKTYTLDVEQILPEGCGQKDLKPFYFPLKLGLLDSRGRELPLRLHGEKGGDSSTRVLVISEMRQNFTFTDVLEAPVPSLLRDFSAPVKLEFAYTIDELMFLLANDPNPFNRFDAAQRMADYTLKKLIAAVQQGKPLEADSKFIGAFGKLLHDAAADPAFLAEAMALPTLTSLTEDMKVCDFDSAYAAKEFLYKALAGAHKKPLEEIYSSLHTPQQYSVDSASIGKRALKNTALAYLMQLEERFTLESALSQFRRATNMTDEISALDILCSSPFQEREEAIRTFYEKWKRDVLVMNKWFAVQAVAKQPDTLERVRRLENDPVFDRKNPNKVRALYGAFSQNMVRFHASGGEGYRYIAEKVIEVDAFNPSVAAKLAGAFKKYAKLDSGRKEKMGRELERILAAPKLSGDVFEIVSKTLASGK